LYDDLRLVLISLSLSHRVKLIGSCRNLVSMGFSKAMPYRAGNFTGSINQIERPFTPDSGKDLGNIWAKRQDQLTPDIKRLAKPNALMFFHIPLYRTIFFGPFLPLISH